MVSQPQPSPALARPLRLTFQFSIALRWKYAVEHDVILKDECKPYRLAPASQPTLCADPPSLRHFSDDQINTDIEPFLSLPASLVLERAQQMLNHTRYMSAEHMFAVEVKAGVPSLMPGLFGETSRAFDVLEGFKRIAKWLPDMAIPFTIEDGPGVAVSGEEKAAHVQAAREGRSEFLF